MGYDLQKRLLTLQTQVDGDPTSKLSIAKALAPGIFVLGCTALLLSTISPAYQLDEEELERSFSESQSQFRGRRRPGEISNTERWALQRKAEVTERIIWLESSWLGSGTANSYEAFAENAFNAFAEIFSPEKESQKPFYILWLASAKNALLNILLRVGFVLIAFWPLWFIAAIGGYGAFRARAKIVISPDLLGICARAGRLFYSGIYGPLRPNASVSGTDYACPSLACPAKAPRSEAIKHPLLSLLREFGAVNGTNFELAQVIIAYKDFPSFVEEERVIEDDSEAGTDTSKIPAIFTPIENVGTHTLERTSIEGLQAVLVAHRALQTYFQRKADAQPTNAVVEDPYLQHFRLTREIAAELPPLAQLLFLSLTPSRGQAVAALPSHLVATAYLAIEAGKSLVFRREGAAFIQVSRFPHLQARAVMQSAVPYHRDYNGDQRLLIRHAIICSRRHGDFGRALLPVQMSPAARGLRDWLEVLYAHPNRRSDAACLNELDAHLEEMAYNWRGEFLRRLETEKNSDYVPHDERLLLWKGIVYKSVVLVPLANLVEIALYGFSRGRLARLSELIRQTRRLQSSLSISARLPGFKRQAEEAEKGSLESGGVTTELAKTSSNADLVEGWLLIRRMLTRYNWLSTRVGDDAVPTDGLVQGTLIYRPSNDNPKVVGIEALVPLRQRRFAEILGPHWERMFYRNAVQQRDVEVFVDVAEYKEALAAKQQMEERGLLKAVPQSPAVGGMGGS